MPQSDLHTLMSEVANDLSGVENLLSLPIALSHLKQDFSGLSHKLSYVAKDDPRFSELDFLIQQTVSLLDFLGVESKDADENVLALLDGIIEVARAETALFAGGDDGEADIAERRENMTNELNALAIYALDALGIDVTLMEDAPVFDDDVSSELDYLSSLIQGYGESRDSRTHTQMLTQKRVKETKDAEAQTKFEPTTRVKSHLLEHLMSYSEELVQIRNTLADFAEKQESLALTELSNKLKTVSDGMLNDLLKTQMRPIGNLLSKYRRIVRDLSKELDKKVDVEIIGENIELDSNVIDAINEPLTHLVRNALDHGFETQEARAVSGKSMVGRLLIHAYNEAGKVVINICDDGKGIDRKKY